MRLARSNAFRVALAFAGGLTLTTYVVFAIVDFQFYRSNVALARSVLEDEVGKALAASTDRLKAQLALRLTQDLRHLDYVGLYDASGRLVFGNLAGVPSVPADGVAHLVYASPPQPEAWQSEHAIFVARVRPDGGKLVLGRSLVYVDEFEHAMRRVFAETVLPVVVLALMIGVLVSIRASRRLLSIKEAIARVMAGELAVRLPVRRSNGDMDELVRAVNHMLDEIGRLVGQIRSVGDNIAHDLRAPLAVTRARLERGLAGRSEQELRCLVEGALADLDRAMTTVAALLRISDLESGLRRGRFAAVHLAALCWEVHELFEPLAEAKGVSLGLAIGGEPVISGDADLLREALTNLVDNAVKFTPSGGRVEVGCGQAGTLLRVRDTGPGVAPEERAKILKRFYRSAATRDLAGVGLGLSITATIVDLHGLSLEIGDAAPGAAFSIAARTAPAEHPAGSRSQAGGLAKRRASLPAEDQQPAAEQAAIRD